MVGAPNKPLELPIFPLLLGRKIVAGSCTGGMKETQAMINFAAKQNITSHIELIPIHYVNTAIERLLKSFFSFFDFSIQNLNRGLRIRTSKDIEFAFYVKDRRRKKVLAPMISTRLAS
ncbi:hypothetical protein G4B88_015192 [Cannabis sativa]|uniref:Uncharacterized protein n=2 Tax=Cannabis sativa TaxID=3483 RepID=A0A7J6DKJ1_CANSA|nr:hypothetical protein G4B88_015192 [Cannabis sativa]